LLEFGQFDEMIVIGRMGGMGLMGWFVAKVGTLFLFEYAGGLVVIFVDW